MHQAWIIAPDVLCVVMCALAAAVDLRSYRIPNWLTFGGAALGLALQLAGQLALRGDFQDFLGHMAPLFGAVVFTLAVTAPLGALRLMGMGDVKLLLAASVCVGWPLIVHLMVYTALAGGVVALVLAVHRGVLRAVLGRVKEPVDSQVGPGHRMPYGLAIALGALWAVASRYQAWLRLLAG